MSTQRLMKMLGWMLAASTAAGCMGGGDSGPSTCKEAKSTYGVSTDGPQTLYLGGDKSMPWSAFCVGMSSETPAEFLELPQYDDAGHTANYSGFAQAASGRAQSLVAAPSDGFAILTHYDKVRIDPVDLTIDITNKTFTRTEAPDSATGSLVSKTLGNMEISYMPYGVAMECGQQLGASEQAVPADANINLGGLPFELVDDQLCTSAGNNTVVRDSSNPTKVVTFHAIGVTSSDGTTMTCGRASVHCLPDPTANGQVGGQTTIPLRYAGTATGFGF